MNPVERRRERGAVRAIGACFAVSALAAAGFATTYTLSDQAQLQGLTLGVAFAGLGLGLGLWARRLLPTGGYVEKHEPFHSPPRDRELAADALTGPESPTRRGGLLAILGVAVTALAGAALFPLRSLLPLDRPRPVGALRTTPWASGVRLVREDGSPLRVSDVPAGSVIGVFPEGHLDSGDAPAFAVRLNPAQLTSQPPGGQIDGVTVYSLLCTHAGCPVRLYLKETGQVLCPCHQSVFDLLAGARPVAGPAARALPGLPIRLDDTGHLIAAGDFTSPPGPGFWSRR